MELTSEQLDYLRELANIRFELINSEEIDIDSDTFREMVINSTTIAEINEELERIKI